MDGRCRRNNDKIQIDSLDEGLVERKLSPDDFIVSPGYEVEVFAAGLDNPIGFTFSERGDLYIADSGINSGTSKVIRLSDGRFDIIAESFFLPITGISSLDGTIYVSHKGFITVLRQDGTRQDIIAGITCNGDFGISNVAFGPEGKIYFGVGTITNSGVVGIDNPWVTAHPFLHDYPGEDILCVGQNFESNNLYISTNERVLTGAFSPYGVPNNPNEVKKGYIKASGSLLRSNRDGSEIELVAWGFRNPIHIDFDRNFQLFVANRGYDVRGSRPIANAYDEFHLVAPGVWYGWPDFSAGEPVTLPKFRPEGMRQPEFLILNHPNVPPTPFAVFPPHSSIAGFHFNYNPDFSKEGDAFITEFGSYGPITMGRSAPYDGINPKVSRIDMNTGRVSTFLMNKSGVPAFITGEGGFGRPIDIKFGPDHAMYILDQGLSNRRNLNRVVPNTGVIWRVTRVANSGI